MNGKMYIGTSSSIAAVKAQTRQLTIAGDTNVSGDLYMGTDGVSRIYANASTDTCIYFDSSQIYIAGTIASIASANIYLGKTAGNGDDINSTITMKGKTYVQSDFYYKSAIYCHDGKSYQPGDTGNYKVSNWLGGGVKLSFINYFNRKLIIFNIDS